MSNATLLDMISDTQMNTQAYQSSSKDDIVAGLLCTIRDLVELYNRCVGESGSVQLVMVESIKCQLEAINRWRGSAFVTGDEVDNALTEITKFIEVRPLSVDINSPSESTKQRFILKAFSNCSYSTFSDAIASGGDWNIGEFYADPNHLTIENLKSGQNLGDFSALLQGADNSAEIFGFNSEMEYFIINNQNDVLFVQNNSNNEWIKVIPQQATINLDVSAVFAGINLDSRTPEITEKLQSLLREAVKELDLDGVSFVESNVNRNDSNTTIVNL